MIFDDDATQRAKDRRRREDLLAGLRLETRLREANPPTPARAAEERQRRYDRIATLLQKVEDGASDVSYIDDETAGMLRRELQRLDAAAAEAAPIAATGPVQPLVVITRRNTILYCRHWLETVTFYRDKLGLPVIAERDWFIELDLTGDSSLSIADATRATISDVGGQGITLSWRVSDLAATRKLLIDQGLEPTDVHDVWDAVACYLFDPEGHRIEIWADGPEP